MPPTNSTIDVGPIGVDDLAGAHRAGRWDPASRRLLEAEFEALKDWLGREGAQHKAPEFEVGRLPPGARRAPDAVRKRDGSLMGLALSGGGIRSATFALGALQLLAREDLLHRFDYLSTVSGGGYIGSALTWWLNRKERSEKLNPGLGRSTFPFGTEDPSDVRLGEEKPAADEGRRAPAERSGNPGFATTAQRNVLRFLRQHGNYLTPGEGLNLVSAAVTALRGVFLSVLAWFAALYLGMLVLLVASGLLDWLWAWLAPRLPAGGGLGAVGEWILAALNCVGLPGLLGSAGGATAAMPLLFRAAMWAAGLGALLMLLAAMVYSFATVFRLKSDRRYRARNWLERRHGRLWLLIGALALLAFASAIGEDLVGVVSQRPLALGGGSLAGGLLAGLWTILRNNSLKPGTIPLPVIAWVGAALLLLGSLVLAYVLARLLLCNGLACAVVAAVLTLLALAYLWWVNLNYVSIHRQYRDRLMEAFLPDEKSTCPKHRAEAPPATEADTALLSAFWRKGKGATHGPYHLINTNVVLVGSKDRTRRLRGGDNFLLSPILCGSSATGWIDTERFLDNRLTLATAMAISGAAANPNTGVGGAGLMRSYAVSFVMTVLGVALGYWVPHPRRAPQRLRPNHLRPGLCGLNPGCFHEQARFIQLSDGGHFENLAVYELIRRRVRLIVVCDGGADPAFAFEDLQVLIRRIEADFGAQIFFDALNRLEMIIPGRAAGYPAGSRTAQQGHLVGEIRYCDGSRGLLVILKSTPIDALSLKTKGYKGAHRDFPDETTADQFFDEDQFEAYRELGYRLAERMVRGARYVGQDGPIMGLPALMQCVEEGHLG